MRIVVAASRATTGAQAGCVSVVGVGTWSTGVGGALVLPTVGIVLA